MRFQRFFPLLGLAALLVTSCEKDTVVEPVQDDTPSNFTDSFTRTLELQATPVHLDVLTEEFSPVKVSDNVRNFESNEEAPKKLRNGVDAQNDMMDRDGFDNFGRSSVFLDANSKIYYSVYRSTQNTAGNRDMCLVFFDGKDKRIAPVIEPITVLEGPPSVALSLALAELGKTYTAAQLQCMFIPVLQLQQGIGSFGSGMSTESYKSDCGTVTIDYQNTSFNTGTLTLVASGCLDAPACTQQYSVSYVWNITF